MAKQYRVRNWRDYKKALVNRGSLTIWFDEKSIKEWHQCPRTGHPGRPRHYSDMSL